jgi:teichuronic acid exporter
VANSLKYSAYRGIIWSAVEKFSVQGGQFIIFIVLARLLMPEDFGLIGMLAIFIAVSQTLIDSGMERGLIQKQNRTSVDFSTVFVFNFLISLGIYCILFFSAPLIADFYKTPQLVSLTRVLTINLVINSLAIVQRSKLLINIDFKSLAVINFISVIVSGGIGIICAYSNMGVWSLVIQNLLRSFISVMMLWAKASWRPSLLFSKRSFHELFGFGFKLLLSGVYAQALNNIYNIVIGRAYSAVNLGYYARGKQFAELSAGTVALILNQVTFPILSSLQDDQKRMISVYIQVVRMTAFIIFPAMTLLSFLAEPLVLLLLTEKWLPMVMLLKLMCFVYIFYPISAINMNILNAIGRSDLFLKVDLSKLPFIVLSLVITIQIGVEAMVAGQVVTSCIAFCINAYYPGKLFGFGAIKQFKEMWRIICATLFMSAAVLIIMNIFSSSVMQLLLGGSFGVTIYLLAAYALKIKEFEEVYGLARPLFMRLGWKGSVS